ncbi:MAG: HAMP domain-containing histidine kinase [Actinomycetaceae bacterium]|nr:HAMP domain-containing histidine kinase [Actinomycetaceae bacterium]
MTDSSEHLFAPLPTEEVEADTSVRGRFARYRQALGHIWDTSRQFRLLTLVVTISLIAMILSGLSVVAAVRSHIFDRTVTTSLERYEGSYTSAQSLFSTVDSPSELQIQNIADQVISSQYDATHEVIGAVILPSVKDSDEHPLKLSTEKTLQLSALITEEFREAVNNNDGAQWREVTLPAALQIGEEDKGEDPESGGNAIIVGQTIDVPKVGVYEFYIAYSLDSEEDLIRSIRKLLIAGFAGVFAVFIISVYVVARSVLQPVRDVTAKAQEIADGDYDVRMKVTGKDELAQLSHSFNRMASSIQDQFARYERVANVQQGFVSAVSHELRTPVTTIRMAGQLMYDKREELPNALRRSVELQHEQLINLDTMLSDLLEISRYDAGAMELNAEKTLVADVVRKAVADQVPLAEANGVEVKIVVEGDTTVEGEQRRIERIIRNLVVNALEHSEGKAVRVRVVGGESAVAVEVSDRGVGLTEEQAANVFKRFWRADSSRVRKSGGTGLGMTLAREDAELHGGTLECIGELGLGSTFLLTLPRVAGADFEPPCPLVVAALEEDWDAPVAEEHKEEEIEVYSWPVEKLDDKDINVTVPSAGVAVISNRDKEAE